MQAAQQEGLVSNAEASRLERDLAAARTAAMANGVGVKSRLQALQIAYVPPVNSLIPALHVPCPALSTEAAWLMMAM